ncbi:MAG: SagB/ThcOx family dehydrogenase [Solirubrobacterales bacterium]
MDNIGDEFQQQTKYRAGLTRDDVVRKTARPELYKAYPDSVKVPLPVFEPEQLVTLDKILSDRKSVRKYQARPLSLGQLSYLLWASDGIQRSENGYEFRTAPSAGALYPIETYIVANGISDLEPGVYHYGLREHELEQIRTGDHREQIAAAALGQTTCAKAALVFAWTAVFARTTCKYGQRAYRYIYLDAGHIAENLALAAVSLGLGTCQIGALFDDEVNKLLGVDGVEESIVYMTTVGVPA